MNTEKNSLIAAPPRVIKTLLRGINTAANHIHLIILPLVIDMILWLGPKIRVKELIMPVVSDTTSNLLRLSPPELIESLKSSLTVWEQMLSQFSLLNIIRTIPVGVPSLVARLSPIVSPLNTGWLYEVPTFQVAAGILGGLLVAGFALGTWYFNTISRYTLPEPEAMDGKKLVNQYIQSLLLFCILIGLAILLSIPLFILLSVFSLISPAFGQFFLLAAIFIILWLIMPMVFSPHGVFVLQQKAFPSMLLSLRLVRIFLPGTGLFIMTAVLISEGFNMLWAIPEPDSWMMLIGIMGHAFIVTGLIAATFLYYREGIDWMQLNIKKATQNSEKSMSGEPPHVQ